MFRDHVNQAYRGTEEMVQNHLQERSHVHLVQDRLQMYPKTVECGLQTVRLFAENLTVQFIEWFKDEVDKGSVLLRVCLLASELTGLGVEVDVPP